MDTIDTTINEVRAELARALRKFPTWPTDPLHALAVMGEEFGELTKDVLQLTYEPHKTSAENVRKEAIQTAAMALRFAASLDRYEYGGCAQHEQQEINAASMAPDVADILECARRAERAQIVRRLREIARNQFCKEDTDLTLENAAQIEREGAEEKR